jgi:acetyltransferase-like isoleucine patch superfamily enzyme
MTQSKHHAATEDAGDSLGVSLNFGRWQMSTLANAIARIPGRLWCLARRIHRRLLMMLLRPLFASHGGDFWFDPAGEYTFGTISVGDHVSLGLGTTLSASRSRIVIGNRVMLAPDVVVRGGNHATSFVGRFMADITESEKKPEDDLGVVIEDDVWIGTRAVILHGVTVGRGAVVGAAALVTKSVPPYAVVGGVPARVLRFRWDVDTILRHESVLYPSGSRLQRTELEKWQRQAG